MQHLGLRRGLGHRLSCRSSTPLSTLALRPLPGRRSHFICTRAAPGPLDGSNLSTSSSSSSNPAVDDHPASPQVAQTALPTGSPPASATDGTAAAMPAAAEASSASSTPAAGPSLDPSASPDAPTAAATLEGEQAVSQPTTANPPSSPSTSSAAAAASSSSNSAAPGSAAAAAPLSFSSFQQQLPAFVRQLLTWLASLWSAVQQFPAWVRMQHLKRLREACEEDPKDASKHAAYLAELVRSDPREVVARVESRQFGVNAAVAAEYLRAMLETGRVEELVKADAAAAAAAAAAAESAPAAPPPPRTLGEVLRDLQEQLTTSSVESVSSSSSAAPAAAGSPTAAGPLSAASSSASPLHDSYPGSSLRRPLHVVLAGGLPPGLQAASGSHPSSSAPTPLLLRPLALLWRLASFAALLVFLSLAWLAGSQAVRRVLASSSLAASVGAVGGGGAALSAAAGGGGAGGSGSSHAGGQGGGPGVEPKEYKKEELPEKSLRTFKDVKGCDEAKEELWEVVEFLKHPTKFTRLGAKLPKGVLLTGPPGTGKTLLARAVAGEAGVPFFYRAGSEFEELYVGVGSRRMRALFAAAKKRSPCIVFIDEIDAIGGNRKAWENHTRKTLNQLLVEMDGFESTEGIIVMAATNLPESLDPALKRPGRFDRQVAVPLPDIRGRRDILDYYLGDKPLGPDVDRELLARQTQGFSGADLSNLVNEAAILAAREGADALTQRGLDWAFDKVLMGLERKSVKRTLEARRRTAYHEAGHALVALATPGAAPIHKATIVPRGHALGMVTQVGREDEFSINRQQMVARMRVCMGGTVAEELVFGADQVSSGATDDLRQATSVARHMVAECGMSPAIGPVYITSHDDRHGGGGGSSVSEATRQAVDAEVAALLAEAKEGVRALLADRMQDLHTLAAALLDRETLTREEISAALQPEQQQTPPQPPHGGNGSGGSGGGAGGRQHGGSDEPGLEDDPGATVPVAAQVSSSYTMPVSVTASSSVSSSLAPGPHGAVHGGTGAGAARVAAPAGDPQEGNWTSSTAASEASISSTPAWPTSSGHRHPRGLQHAQTSLAGHLRAASNGQPLHAPQPGGRLPSAQSPEAMQEVTEGAGAAALSGVGPGVGAVGPALAVSLGSEHREAAGRDGEGMVVT